MQRDLIARLAASPSRFVLASRFTARAHRLLRDAPARFEVMHVPALTPAEVAGAGASRFDGGRRDMAAVTRAAIAALAAGRAAYAHLLLEALASQGPSLDPIGGARGALRADGRLTARCRESYEFRLHRARGYGALKAILGVLADDEPLNLTEIAQQLHRTPGSTKDYLSWLEDVDLVIDARQALHATKIRCCGCSCGSTAGRCRRPTRDVVREVRAYARRARLQSAAGERRAAQPRGGRLSDRAGARCRRRRPGIIEID